MDKMDRSKIQEEFEGTSYAFNDEFTLNSGQLAVIYHTIHVPRQGDGRPWTYVQMKQIVGYDMLKLNEQQYNRLDLNGVIEVLRDEDDKTTKAIKPVADRNKPNLRPWVKGKSEKYLDEAVSVGVPRSFHAYILCIPCLLAGFFVGPWVLYPWIPLR